VPIRAEHDLPRPANQWSLVQRDGESDFEFQARIALAQQVIQKVQTKLGSYNHLPPRGLFQDQINRELWRLINLLVVKIGVLQPFKVFASMRFPNGKPLPEAFQLKDILAKKGIDLFVVRVTAGDSINATVFDTAMDNCVAFVAFGSITYGQDTGNDASSHCEVLRWNEEYAPIWGPIIPVRLIPWGEEFEHKTGQEVFSNDALSLSWEQLGPEQVANEIAFAVSQRIKRHLDFAISHDTSTIDDMAEKAKSFLWQAASSTNVPLNIPATTGTIVTSAEEELAMATKRLKKVRVAMKKLPHKEERSEQEAAKYKKLKKEAMRLQNLVSASS